MDKLAELLANVLGLTLGLGLLGGAFVMASAMRRSWKWVPVAIVAFMGLGTVVSRALRLFPASGLANLDMTNPAWDLLSSIVRAIINLFS